MVAALALLAALTACGLNESNEPDVTADQAQAQACDAVNAGIDAFNAGDFDKTIASFVKAKEPAKAFADKSESSEADDLVAAVDYYATLPADDYPEASASSKDFAKYKAITLGQCATDPNSDFTQA